MKFGSNRKIVLCGHAALGLLIFCCIFILVQCIGGCFTELISVGVMLVTRLVAFICLGFMIHRLRLTDEVIVADLSILKAYSSFGANCGDPLAKLNVETIKLDLNEADGMLQSAIYFSAFCVLWYILEVVVLLMFVIPVKAISKTNFAENLKLFFGCTEFATYMKVSVMNS